MNKLAIHTHVNFRPWNAMFFLVIAPMLLWLSMGFYLAPFRVDLKLAVHQTCFLYHALPFRCLITDVGHLYFIMKIRLLNLARFI